VKIPDGPATVNAEKNADATGYGKAHIFGDAESGNLPMEKYFR
jgi:hypothetical protein